MCTRRRHPRLPLPLPLRLPLLPPKLSLRESGNDSQETKPRVAHSTNSLVGYGYGNTCGRGKNLVVAYQHNGTQKEKKKNSPLYSADTFVRGFELRPVEFPVRLTCKTCSVSSLPQLLTNTRTQVLLLAVSRSTHLLEAISPGVLVIVLSPSCLGCDPLRSAHPSWLSCRNRGCG